LIDFGIASTLGPNGKSANFWNAEIFAAPEVINGEETDFGGDVFYLGNTFYSIIHPKSYTPWTNAQKNLDSI
jgi:serine/threonine protein kinase